MSDNNNVQDTEELRRVIAELQAKVNALEEQNDDNATGEALAGLSSEDSYVAYRGNEELDDVSGYEPEVYEDEVYEEPELTEEDIEQQERVSRKKRAIMDEEFGDEDEAPVRHARSEKPDKKSVKKKRKKKSDSDEDVIISLEHVTKAYVKGIPAIDDINIKIRKGEFVFIVGDSGSGKSTLIRLLLREIKPTSGKIMVNGFQVEKLRQRKVPKLRRSMGVVFQDFRLLKDRSVYENVAFAQRIVQTPLREMKKNVPNALKVVGLASKYRARTDELSGGERQRVAIARALVNNPPILLADEPTGNLDPRNTTEIMNLLEEINNNGTTVIVVTHNDKVVNDMKKRVITIKKGIVVSDQEKGGYIDEDY